MSKNIKSTKHILIDIPVVWEYVRTVRQRMQAALLEYPEELRSAAVMVASELVENAIKHSVVVPALEWTRFEFDMQPDEIQIQVSNGVTDLTLLDLVQRIVKQTQTAKSAEQLYVERLQELMNNPVQANRLGLYRIASEGKFALDWTYADQVLTMTARRRIP